MTFLLSIIAFERHLLKRNLWRPYRLCELIAKFKGDNFKNYRHSDDDDDDASPRPLSRPPHNECKTLCFI